MAIYNEWKNMKYLEHGIAITRQLYSWVHTGEDIAKILMFKQ